MIPAPPDKSMNRPTPYAVWRAARNSRSASPTIDTIRKVLFGVGTGLPELTEGVSIQ